MMDLNFDFNKITTTEFGVGFDREKKYLFTHMPSDQNTKEALRKMAEATSLAMQEKIEAPRPYEPSEKYAGSGSLYLLTSDPLAEPLLDLHKATNLPTDASALTDPSMIACYFAQFRDEQGCHLTALKRAAQFKGILKKRLIRLCDDSWKFVEDTVFVLDNDFDLLVSDDRLYILRPSSFEAIGKLTQTILDAVPKNVAIIQQEMPIVNFSAIQDYASKHPRAARYLASIRTQKLAGMNYSALENLCEKTNVEIEEIDEKINVPEKHIMGFLEVLDRRRYPIELIDDTPESYRATSREKLGALQ